MEEIAIYDFASHASVKQMAITPAISVQFGLPLSADCPISHSLIASPELLFRVNRLRL
jgi:hypothetical protein